MADRHFSDGELIYRTGDPADGVYRIRTGGVRLQRGAGQQPETPYLGADEIFGNEGFLTGDARDTDAVAVGDVVVEYLRRNEFLAILTVQPHLMSPLFDPVFDLVRTAADGEAKRARDDKPAQAGSEASNGSANGGAVADTNPESATDSDDILLVIAGKRLRSLIGAEEIPVRELPFRIGRSASGEGKETYGDVHLAIDDTRPFNLSRRHFSIERENGGLIVRDCGSYHGTTLNGQILGGEGRPKTAPLMTGESELIAGRSDSPFRFRILVGHV